MSSLNQLKFFYETDGKRTFNTIPSLFVLIRDSTKSFKESNFNVAKSLLEIFTLIFDVHSQLVKAPEYWLYFPATKLAVEKVGDRKLSGASSSCLNAICTAKDPQRVLAAAVKTIGDVKSPLVHEALLGWFNAFCIDFGAASLAQGVQDCLIWVLKVRLFGCTFVAVHCLAFPDNKPASTRALKECESNNMKVRKAALDVMGCLHSQLGPLIQAFVKSKDIPIRPFEKTFSDNPHDENAHDVKRKLKCATLSSESGNSSHQDRSRSRSILSIPTTDLVASLKVDCLTRIGTTEGKNSWKLRKEAMEEVKTSLSKRGGLITTDANAFSTSILVLN